MTDPADARMTRLQWAVQALARPAKDQLTLFPDFVCKADELWGPVSNPAASSGRASARAERLTRAFCLRLGRLGMVGTFRRRRVSRMTFLETPETRASSAMEKKACTFIARPPPR